MRRKRRYFSREDKLHLLREAEAKSLAEVCREYNIDKTLLSKWKGEFSRDPNEAFTATGDESVQLKMKIAEYERLIGQLCLENRFLKKTSERLQQRAAEERKKG